jgi:hypothetical protein
VWGCARCGNVIETFAAAATWPMIGCMGGPGYNLINNLLLAANVDDGAATRMNREAISCQNDGAGEKCLHAS